MSQLFKLKNGTVLLSTEAPGGVYNSAQLKKIADLCSKELAVVKATEDQRLALFVKESEVESVIEQLRAIGLGIRNYQEGLHQPLSCLGELCEEHEQPALTTAMDLTRELAAISLQSSLKIGINGCARCCTPCHTLDISVLGEPSGYRVSLGGKTSQFPELSSFFAEGVPAKDLPRLIKGVVVLYKRQAEPGESLHDVLERCGTEEYIKALSPYSQDAAQRDDPFASSEAPAAEDDSELPIETSDSAGSDDAIMLEDDGEIALESDGDIPLESDDEIPLEADDEIALEGDDGISLESDVGLSLESDEGISLDTDDAIALESDEALSLDTDDTIALESDEGLSLDTDEAIALEADDEIALEDADDFNIDAIEADTSPAIDINDSDLSAPEESLDDMIADDGPSIDTIALEDDIMLDEQPAVAAAKVSKSAGPTAHDAADDNFELKELEDDLNLDDDTLGAAATAPKAEDTFSLDDGDKGELEEIPIGDDGQGMLDDDLDLSDTPHTRPQDDDLKAIEAEPEVLAVDAATDELDSIEVDEEEFELETPSDHIEVASKAPASPAPTDDELDFDVTEDALSDDNSSEENWEEPIPVPTPALVTHAASAVGEDSLYEDAFGDAEEDMDLLDGGLGLQDDNLELQDESLEDQAVRALASEESDSLGFDEIDTDDIPELDNELAPEQLQKNKNQKVSQSQAPAAAAAALIPEDDFDAELGQPTSALSDAEESDFEAKLEASIDEESRLLANDEPDLNVGERQAALSMLENPSMSSVSTLPKPASKASSTSVKQLPRKAKDDKSFRLAGVSFEHESMRVMFASGAYMEIDLGQVELHEQRSFTVGHEEMIVTQTEDGYFLEMDGMKMFYPKTALSAAS